MSGRHRPWFDVPTLFPAEQSETAFLTERAIEWLDRNGEFPFFMHVSYVRPHPPRRNPAGYHDRYSEEQAGPFAGFGTVEEQAGFHPLNRLLLSLPSTAAPADRRGRRQLRATYYGEQGEVDVQLGRLFDYLGAGELRGGTLVVLTIGHGEMGGDHWLVEKCGYWDESFHVPLIVRDPTPAAAGTRGAVVDEPTESVDIAATILDWLGTEAPRQFDGWPLTAFLQTGRAPQRWRHTVHYEWDLRQVQRRWAERNLGIPSEHCSLTVARSATTKYVQFAADPEVLGPLLFDMARPDGHTRDLLADGGTRGVEQEFEMAQEMLRWKSRDLERSLADCYLAPGIGPVWGRSLWR